MGQKISAQIKYYDYVESPIGPLFLAGCTRYLRLLGFSQGSHARAPGADWQKDETRFALAKAQLAAYFAGELKRFDLALKPEGTAFQMAAWAALQNIPYGETRSYGQQAAMIGNPKAARAIGGANNANPIPVIIPCHRVIGAGGALTGFGGGLKTKAFLLGLEGAL